MSNQDEPFEGQNSQFGQQPPQGPTGNIPPYAQQPPYGQPSPPYGQQSTPPYGSSVPPYGEPSPPDPYSSGTYGQTSYGQPSYPRPAYGQPAPWGQPMGPPPPNYLAWAIITTLLCCMPLGIASIVFAAQVGTKWASGDYAGANHSSLQAKRFAIWSAAAAGIVIVGYLLLGLVGMGLDSV